MNHQRHLISSFVLTIHTSTPIRRGFLQPQHSGEAPQNYCFPDAPCFAKGAENHQLRKESPTFLGSLGLSEGSDRVPEESRHELDEEKCEPPENPIQPLEYKLAYPQSKQHLCSSPIFMHPTPVP